MASTILADNGASSGSAGIKTSADSTGVLALQTTTAGGAATTAVTIGTDQSVTFAQAANLPNTFGFKNRIINGAMMIDQRNAGASVSNTTGAVFPIDRFYIDGSASSKFTAQQSTTAPTGFKNSLLLTSSAATSLGSTDYYRLQHNIEGFNCADLGWGTASAQTVTLSFWVRSSLTGTFSGVLRNSSADRSYPYTYTINSANTWEQKTITIAGDTTGTWNTSNSIGVSVFWSLGSGSSRLGTAGAWAAANYLGATGETSFVGTSGATLYITGVQLEKGSTATSFDYRPYGTELQLCQRYYFFWDFGTSVGNSSGPAGVADSTTLGITPIMFPVTMRSSPSSMDTSGTAADYAYRVSGGSTISCNGVPSMNNPKPQSAWVNATVASGLTAGACVLLRGNNASVSKGLGFNAEL